MTAVNRLAAVVAAAALLACAVTTPLFAQDNPFAGNWMCRGTIQGGVQVAYQITLQGNGVYTGTYETANGYRSFSQGPYRLIGNILRFDFQVWQTVPQQTTNPGGDGYYYQFQGPNVLYLRHYRCPENPECILGCQRTG